MKATSIFPFGVDPKASRHTEDRIRSLFRFNDVRIMQLLELVQYGFLYFVLGFIFGSSLEMLFPTFEEEKPVQQVAVEVLGQSLIFVILVFYIRKIAKLVPFLFVLKWDLDGNGRIPTYRPYETSEYAGEITIALVLIASQVNLLKKIDLLSRSVYKFFMGGEKHNGLAM